MIVLRKPKTSSEVVINGSLIGTLDGSNKVFTTEYNYKTGCIYINANGQMLKSPYDFIESGNNQITFVNFAPKINWSLSAIYEKDIS